MKELPKYDCASDRHEWKDDGQVLVEIPYFFGLLRKTREREKLVCKRCGKVTYEVPFDGLM